MLNFSVKNAFIIDIVLHAIYELKDLYCSYILKSNKQDNSWCTNSSFLNATTDTISNILGFYIASVLDKDEDDFLLIVGTIITIFITLIIFYTIRNR